jgi:hypothetical protein
MTMNYPYNSGQLCAGRRVSIRDDSGSSTALITAVVWTNDSQPDRIELHITNGPARNGGSRIWVKCSEWDIYSVDHYLGVRDHASLLLFNPRSELAKSLDQEVPAQHLSLVPEPDTSAVA